eukprot:SAG11_NODE_1054_length_6018_cov_2.481250_3_plen_149_part_00
MVQRKMQHSALEAAYSDSDEENEDPYGYADVLDEELEAAYDHYRARVQKKESVEENDDLNAPVQVREAKKKTQESQNELIASIPEDSANDAAALWFQQPVFSTVNDSDEVRLPVCVWSIHFLIPPSGALRRMKIVCKQWRPVLVAAMI